jgi:hypothetical protein
MKHAFSTFFSLDYSSYIGAAVGSGRHVSNKLYAKKSHGQKPVAKLFDQEGGS